MTTKTELLNNGVVVATKTAAPFYSWDWTPATSGASSLTYKRYEDNILVFTSGATTGTVEAPVAANFPVWSATGDNGAAFLTALNSELPKTSPAPNNTITEIATGDTTASFFSGNLAPNGFIYMIPSDSTYVLKVDPINNTTSQIGTGLPTTIRKYRGSGLATNNCIYGFNYDGGNILKVDTITDIVTTIATPAGKKCFGAVTANNGFIYTVPYFSDVIIKFDPSTDTYTTITYAGTSSGTTYRNGVLAKNGMIYMFPYIDKGKVLRLDPSTDLTTEIGTDYGTGTPKWNNGVLAPNGKIYCYAPSSLGILEIDPDTDTTRIIAHALTTSGIMGALLPSGKLLISADAGTGNTTWKIFDPADDSVVELGNSNLYASNIGSILAENGNVYHIPTARNIQVFGSNSYTLPSDMVLSRHLN